MVCEAGVRFNVGVVVVQTFSVVVTLLEVTFAWFALAAVTDEVFVPLIWPAFAFTVRVTVLLVAPDASVTEAALRVEALKAVVLLSLFVRLNVSFAQPESLFVMVRLYTMVPLSVEIVPDAGARLIDGTLRMQGVTLIVVVTVLDTPFAWVASVAVTDVLVVPVSLPATAVTFSGTVVLAPDAKVIGERFAGTVKSVLFEFATGRLKVVLPQATSLFVMLTV
jgi:hypothetical protein